MDGQGRAILHQFVGLLNAARKTTPHQAAPYLDYFYEWALGPLKRYDEPRH
jgi:hypothetical protein